MMKTPVSKIAKASSFFAVCALVAACSGGGSPQTSSPPPPPTGGGGSGPTWTQGVFQPASQFKNRCEVARTGVNIEGDPFPDLPGSELEEKFWLRSWTNETYLWNDEVVDQNPASFGSPVSYFNVLRTTEQTPSGKDKDDFHFSQSTEDFLERRNSAPRSGYGVRYVVFSNSVPRDFRIQYTEPNSPASQVVSGQQNFVRGSRILEVDGVDLVNATGDANIDILNDGLFPETAGEQHTFVLEDVGSSMPRTVVITSANVTQQPVNRTRIINTPTGDVGYILLNTFSPFSTEQDLANAISSMSAAGVSDLVLDLRYNGGGLLAIASQLGYMVAGGSRTNGKTFELLRFNDDAGNRNPVTGEINDPVPFYTTGLGFSVNNGVPLDTLNLPRVFILSTDDTCSASESILNSLRGIDVEVILIGGTTCGKPFGFYPTDNCGTTYFTIQFQGVNDKGFGDYADGFTPDNSSAAFGVRAPGCSVADDLSNELGDQNEDLLAAALQFRETGTCPAPTGSKPAPKATSSKSTVADEATAIIVPARDPFETNRDMTLPDQ